MALLPRNAAVPTLRAQRLREIRESSSHTGLDPLEARGFPEHLEKDASQAGLEVPP